MAREDYRPVWGEYFTMPGNHFDSRLFPEFDLLEQMAEKHGRGMPNDVRNHLDFVFNFFLLHSINAAVGKAAVGIRTKYKHLYRQIFEAADLSSTDAATVAKHLENAHDELSKLKDIVGTHPLSAKQYARPSGSLRTVSLRPGFFTWDMLKGVKLFNDQELTNYIAKSSAGKLCRSDGTPMDSSHIAGPNPIWVLLPDTTLYVSYENVEKFIQHTSLSRFWPVAGVGEMKIVNGIIEHMNDNGGHNGPPKNITYQSADWFRKQGLTVKEVKTGMWK